MQNATSSAFNLQQPWLMSYSPTRVVLGFSASLHGRYSTYQCPNLLPNLQTSNPTMSLMQSSVCNGYDSNIFSEAFIDCENQSKHGSMHSEIVVSKESTNPTKSATSSRVFRVPQRGAAELSRGQAWSTPCLETDGVVLGSANKHRRQTHGQGI